MAAASQAVPGEFDSRHLLQKEGTPYRGVFLFGRRTPTKDFRKNLCIVLNTRKTISLRLVFSFFSIKKCYNRKKEIPYVFRNFLRTLLFV